MPIDQLEQSSPDIAPGTLSAQSSAGDTKAEPRLGDILRASAAAPVSDEAAAALREYAAWADAIPLWSQTDEPSADSLNALARSWRKLGFEEVAPTLSSAASLYSPIEKEVVRSTLPHIVGNGSSFSLGKVVVDTRTLRFVDGMRTYDGEPQLGMWSDGHYHYVGSMLNRVFGPPHFYLYMLAIVSPAVVAAITEGHVTVATVLSASPPHYLHLLKFDGLKWLPEGEDRDPELTPPKYQLPGLSWQDLRRA